MSASRIVPLGCICVLALAVLLRTAGGKKAQTFDGVFVRALTYSEFYQGAKGCTLDETPLFVVPGSDLEQQTPMPIENLFRPIAGEWRVRFVGDLSPIGRYGKYKKYWRTVRVTSVLRVEPLDSCENLK